MITQGIKLLILIYKAETTCVPCFKAGEYKICNDKTRIL